MNRSILKLAALLAVGMLAVSAHGTVTSTTSRVTFTCTGSVGPFAFTFPISDPTAMTVTQNGTLLASNLYTITPVNNSYENGGSVTLVTACPNTQPLVLTRVTPLTQETLFYDNMPAPMTQFMLGLDKLTEITQEQATTLNAATCPGTEVLVSINPLQCVANGGGSGGGGTTTYAVTFDSSNAGASSSTPFNGGAAKLISANTIGALSTTATASQTLAGPVVIPGITPTGPGIADWHDTTAGCHAYRGQVNVLDCGGSANGAFIVGACGNTSPNGCFAGADNTAPIRNAIAACSASVSTGSGGCTVLLPNSGTNIWMVGANASAVDECATNSQTGYYGIFNIPNGVTIQGQGRWITTVMANPGTAQSRTCAMFQNTAAIPIGIKINGLRLDGNEGTNSSHTDWLHPNNNFGTSTNYLMGLNFNGTQQSGPALSMTDFVISGFPGSGADGPLIYASSLLGGNIYVEFSDGSIIFNEYGTFVLQLSDSTFDSIKWQNNGSWNGFDGLDIYNGGSSFIANYFGGGSYGTAQVNVISAQGNRFISDVFDNTGGAQLSFQDAASPGGYYSAFNLVANSTFSQPGNGGNNSTSTTSITIGTGSKTFTTSSGAGYYVNQPIFIQQTGSSTNYMSGQVTSYSGTTLVVNITYTVGSGTYATWNINGDAPFILLGGHSNENVFTGNYCNTGPLGHSTWCVQETGSAGNNNYTGFTVSLGSPPLVGAFELASSSQACATLGAANVNCNSSTAGVTQITGPTSTVAGAMTFTGSGVSQSGGTFTFSSGTVSGQTNGKIPLATASTTIGASSHLDDGLTTAATITSTEPIAITGPPYGMSVPSGTQLAGAPGAAVYGADSGSSGFAEVDENNGGYSRICTVGNAQCLTSTPSTLLASGIVDGTAPMKVTTVTSCTLGTTSGCSATAYNSGYTINEYATAGTAITYTLPTAAAGKQYCVSNGYNGSAANTGTLEILTSASGQFIIFTDGTLSATGGYVISSGAARDSACVVGVDSTHWILYVQSGTWVKH